MRKASSSFAALRLLGNPLTTRTSFVAIAVLVFFVPHARAALLTNGGFDTVGPAGSPMTSIGQAFDPSAAAGWEQYAIVPSSYFVSELLPTTDPTGSGSMMHVITTAGDWPPAEFGNGFEQFFTTLNSAVFSFDLYVVSGQVTGGLVLASSGAYVDYPTFGPTGGWIHVTDHSTLPVNDVAFETLTLTGGAEYYVDNAVLSAVPEPSSLAIAGIAILAGLCQFKTRRRISV
jgi:hypothetical protein